MQTRKITKEVYTSEDSKPIKMNRKMHTMCKLTNVAKFVAQVEK